MNTTTRRHTIAALLSVIGALLILGGTAQAATSKPAGMSNAEYRALVLPQRGAEPEVSPRQVQRGSRRG